MEANCPGLMVTGEATPTTTGAFEVVNKKTEKVYHSKLNGDGYLDNNKAALQKVIDTINADKE